MANNNRTKEVAEWGWCLILQNCDELVDEFMAKEGADELIVKCAATPVCELTEVYVRNPEPREMACKVIGSTCIRQCLNKF